MHPFDEWGVFFDEFRELFDGANSQQLKNHWFEEVLGRVRCFFPKVDGSRCMYMLLILLADDCIAMHYHVMDGWLPSDFDIKS